MERWGERERVEDRVLVDGRVEQLLLTINFSSWNGADGAGGGAVVVVARPSALWAAVVDLVAGRVVGTVVEYPSRVAPFGSVDAIFVPFDAMDGAVDARFGADLSNDDGENPSMVARSNGVLEISKTLRLGNWVVVPIVGIESA